jgi:ABC-type multidrug transport system ATPase subunit
LKGADIMSYAIEVKNLTKTYKGINAVDNLSIHVPEGKIYGFLGKNGAGKTTTIRMLTRLIKPNSEKYLCSGRISEKTGSGPQPISFQ